MVTSGLLVCDVCDRFVREVKTIRDNFSGNVYITIECHGEREQFVLSQDEIESGTPIHLDRAFRKIDRKLRLIK